MSKAHSCLTRTVEAKKNTHTKKLFLRHCAIDGSFNASKRKFVLQFVRINKKIDLEKICRKYRKERFENNIKLKHNSHENEHEFKNEKRKRNSTF